MFYYKTKPHATHKNVRSSVSLLVSFHSVSAMVIMQMMILLC